MSVLDTFSKQPIEKYDYDIYYDDWLTPGDGVARIVSIEIVKPGGIEPDPELTKRLATEAHQRGVIVLTCGTYGNVFRMLPPLSMMLITTAQVFLAASLSAAFMTLRASSMPIGGP